MKITVVFDSLEEFQQHMMTGAAILTLGKESITIGPEKVLPDAADATAEAAQEPAPAPEVPFEEEKPKEFKDTGTGTITGATPEEQKQIEAEEKAPAQPEVKVETVRKLLADLNKKAGKNVAKELIRSVGYKKLTDVPQGALLTLQGLAEEEMGKYA